MRRVDELRGEVDAVHPRAGRRREVPGGTPDPAADVEQTVSHADAQQRHEPFARHATTDVKLVDAVQIIDRHPVGIDSGLDEILKDALDDAGATIV